MSVILEHVSKAYGRQKALDDIVSGWKKVKYAVF